MMTTKMRYFTYVEPDEDDNPLFFTHSEEHIRENYYPYWKEQMTKAGLESKISFENCLDEWQIVNWAWETDEHGNEK